MVACFVGWGTCPVKLSSSELNIRGTDVTKAGERVLRPTFPSHVLPSVRDPLLFRVATYEIGLTETAKKEDGGTSGRRVADKLQTGGGKIALCQLLASRAPGSRTPGSRFLTLWLPRLLLHFTFALHIRPTSIPKPSDRPPSALCHQRCGRRIRRVPYPPLRRFVFHSRGPRKKTKSPGRPPPEVVPPPLLGPKTQSAPWLSLRTSAATGDSTPTDMTSDGCDSLLSCLASSLRGTRWARYPCSLQRLPSANNANNAHATRQGGSRCHERIGGSQDACI